MDANSSSSNPAPQPSLRYVDTGQDTTDAKAKSWVLCRDIDGLVNQCVGLAKAVSCETTYHATRLRNPWRRLPLKLIPSWPSAIHENEFLNDSPPKLIVSGGRQAVPTSLYLKKKYGDRVFTVHVQDPTIDSQRFDLVVAPAHDAVRGENVVATTGAVHHVDTEKLLAASQTRVANLLLARGKPVVAVLLGGPNKYYDFADSDVGSFVSHLRAIADGVLLVIARSRRTPDRLWEQCHDEFSREHFVWDGVSENPYLPSISIADSIVTTGDSVSMISEAATTGKPIHVFQLTERRKAKRFRRFHEQFRELGITRDFEGELEEWGYEPPNDTARIAALIRQQMAKRNMSRQPNLRVFPDAAA